MFLELTLLRLFAVQQFYRFAFMAISLAVLGVGASGSLLAVSRRRPSAPSLFLAFGATTLGAYLVINYLPFDSFSIAWDRRQVVFLALYKVTKNAKVQFIQGLSVKNTRVVPMGRWRDALNATSTSGR